jgi:hypothetical protein
VGAYRDVAVGARRFLHLRDGAGVVLGTVGDSRTGTFQPPFGPSYSIGPVGDAPFAAFAYVDPEVRAGLRVTEHVEVSAGLEALVLIGLTRPTWDHGHRVDASRDGVALFAADRLAGPLALMLAPGLAARYDF